jgi:hypothetical protein
VNQREMAAYRNPLLLFAGKLFPSKHRPPFDARRAVVSRCRRKWYITYRTGAFRALFALGESESIGSIFTWSTRALSIVPCKSNLFITVLPVLPVLPVHIKPYFSDRSFSAFSLLLFPRKRHFPIYIYIYIYIYINRVSETN